MDRRWALFALLCFACVAYAANTTDDADDDSFATDPILKYRPSFACSLPIQILMTGIVVTLTSVLLIHLIFTAQYHWPLAPVNYALQLSAVITLMVSLIATLHVILDTATKESRQWPYMLNYIAVDIPPLQLSDNMVTTWRQGELAAWLLMNATTSALIQITHIQFLTLLFPSSLERRLIFVLLGPLAIVAAVMQLVPINDSTGEGKLTSIASAVQNVCNATLSLLFTASLFIWGFFVNRKQAWRTDGGTAAFGAGALALALASTVITFIYIPSKDHYVWMPGLMWAVILWQSFLGWWWWVGSGMGVGEVDEILRREEKRRRKRKARSDARQIRREKAQTIWRGVTGALGCDHHNRLNHRRSRSGGGAASGTDGEHERRSSSREGSQISPTSPTRRVARKPSSLHTASSSAASSSAFARHVKNYTAMRVLYGWYLRLRHAHLAASREQAEENAEKIQQVYGREGGEAGTGEVDPGAVGWGLGMYGLRQRRDDSGEREEGLRGIVQAEEDGQSSESSSVDVSMEERHEGEGEHSSARRRRHKVRRTNSTQLQSTNTMQVQSTLPDPTTDQPLSIWYWGPLRRWRLRDSTVYS